MCKITRLAGPLILAGFKLTCNAATRFWRGMIHHPRGGDMDSKGVLDFLPCHGHVARKATWKCMWLEIEAPWMKFFWDECCSASFWSKNVQNLILMWYKKCPTQKNQWNENANHSIPTCIQKTLGFKSNTCGWLKSFMDVGSTVQQLTELTETGGDLFQDVDVCQTRDT